MKTILDRMQAEGDLQRDPQAVVDTASLYDFEGNPIQFGNTDPNIIGPDDTAEFSYRTDKDYPDVPLAVKNAEVSFVLPVAKFLASSVNITVIDETLYGKILEALKTRSLFVMMNLHGVKIQEGIARWYGLILVCKRHPVVMVQFKLKLQTDQIGISLVKLWQSAHQRYVKYGDPEGRRLLTREEVSALIVDYLKKEGIVPNL